jgi:hypothetical protein
MMKKKRHFAVCESGLKFSIRPFQFSKIGPPAFAEKECLGRGRTANELAFDADSCE